MDCVVTEVDTIRIADSIDLLRSPTLPLKAAFRLGSRPQTVTIDMLSSETTSPKHDKVHATPDEDSRARKRFHSWITLMPVDKQ